MTVNSYDRNILKKGILYVFLIIITILIIVLELIKFECKNTYTYISSIWYCKYVDGSIC